MNAQLLIRYMMPTVTAVLIATCVVIFPCAGDSVTRSEAIVAETLWREARGEGTAGINAVASVILNRCTARRADPADVCLDRFQFSCWNGCAPEPDERPRKRVCRTDADRRAWAYCRAVAALVVHGEFVSTVGGANHFYCINSRTPYWANRLKDVRRVGGHVFGTL